MKRKQQRCSNGIAAPNKCAYALFSCFLLLSFMPVIHGVCVCIRFLYGYDFLSIFLNASHCEGSHQRSWEKRVSLIFFSPFIFLVPFGKHLVARNEREKNQPLKKLRWRRFTVWSVKPELAIWWILVFFVCVRNRWKPHCPYLSGLRPRSIFR